METRRLRLFTTAVFAMVMAVIPVHADVTLPVRAPVEMVDTATAGFVGVATQGPFNQPVLLKGYAEFETVFGAPGVKTTARYLAHAVQAFFANGGRRLYVVRAIDSSPSSLLGDAPAGTGNGSGLAALESLDDIALVAAPGYSGPVMHTGLINHCTQMQRFCLLDPATTNSVAGVISERQQINSPDGYAALFFPWVKFIPAGESSEVNAPPSGFAAGIYARVSQNNGVWQSPAGTSADLILATGLSYALTTSEVSDLNFDNVNSIRELTGFGILIWGARTISPDPEWRFVSVRRTASTIKRSLDEGLKWVLYEPNDNLLWSLIRVDTDTFLDSLYRQGAFQGTTPSEAYFSFCGLGETMTSLDITNGLVKLSAGFSLTAPAEFTTVDLVFDQNNIDTDGDGLLDSVEDANDNGRVDAGETNPLNPDSDYDGIEDGVEDANLNGMVDPGEADPLNPDTDGDGITDGFETETSGTDPVSADMIYTIDTLPDPGDMNMDGDVNTGDMLLLQKQLLGNP